MPQATDSNQGVTMQKQQFTDDEIANLREIFDLFDKDHKGAIDIKDLEAII